MPDTEPTRRFRLRFSLRQLFLAVTLVGIGLAVWNWVFRKEATVRVATAEDEREIYSHENANPQRSAAVVTGSFMRNTSLMVSLHVVQAGIVEHLLPGRAFGRDVVSKGRFWENVQLWLYGHGAGLRMIWNAKGDIERWEQWFNSVEHTINVVAKKTLSGKVSPGRPHIVYVEGDQWINVDGKMTVDDFAEANPGNYLVVTVEVR